MKNKKKVEQRLKQLQTEWATCSHSSPNRKKLNIEIKMLLWVLNQEAGVI